MGVLALGLTVAACSGPTTPGTDAASTADIQTMTDTVSPIDAAGPTDAGHGDTGTGTDAMTGSDAPPAGHSFATATPLAANVAPTAATLLNPATQDYYSFTATAGDRLAIVASAQSLVMGGTGNDPSIIDTVVTVFDSSMRQIAQDDDAHPRVTTDAQLFFEAPATGTYYVTVGDCNGAIGSTTSCAPATAIMTFDYDVALFQTSRTAFPETNAASTQDGTTAHAQPITYAIPAGGTAGQYGNYILDGNFAGATATHVYAFTPPMGVSVGTGERAHAYFWVQPTGVHNGDGSTANVRVWVTDATGTTVLVQADENNYQNGDNATNGPLELALPVTLGQQYYLFVQSTATTSAPATDYYFIEHTVGDFYYGTTETEGPTGSGANDVSTAAQTLTTPMGVAAGDFFVDGNISSATDVDWFSMAVPASATSAAFTCTAARDGSGTLGFTAALFDASGTLMFGSALGPEAAVPMTDLFSPMIRPPFAIATSVLRVSATGQSSTVTGTAYWCNVYFQ